MPAPATVLVMASRSGTAALSSRLGPERSQALSELLLARALAAAGQTVGSDRVHRAPPIVDDGPPLSLAAAVELVWPGASSDDPGPLLILWPDLPRWRPAHIDAALSDFAAGCELIVGPVFDGGFYLLGLARPLPFILELEPEAWRSPTIMGATLGAAVEAEVTTGLLRAERAVHTPEDASAALADPLLDDELRGLLG